MNFSIQPVSFKGIVKVTSKENKDAKPQTRYYTTTKKQDGELLKAAADNLRSIGYKEGVYGKDTYKFHNTLEKVIGTEIPQPGTDNSKFFAIGGDVDNTFHTKKYNTSYNKILYRDINTFSCDKYPSSVVTVDLMEPEERLEAARETLFKIQNKLADMSGAGFDLRLFSVLLEDTTKPEEKYADIETALNETLYFLDGNIGGPDFLDKTPEFKSSKEAYDKLIENLIKVTGINDIMFLNNSNRAVNPVFGDKEMDCVRRAVYYLDKLNEKS